MKLSDFWRLEDHKPGETTFTHFADGTAHKNRMQGNDYVSSHTFRFVSPAVSESLKIPNACNVCHTDKSTAWASDTLKTWVGFSPWRVAP